MACSHWWIQQSKTSNVGVIQHPPKALLEVLYPTFEHFAESWPPCSTSRTSGFTAKMLFNYFSKRKERKKESKSEICSFSFFFTWPATPPLISFGWKLPHNIHSPFSTSSFQEPKKTELQQLSFACCHSPALAMALSAALKEMMSASDPAMHRESRAACQRVAEDKVLMT